MSGPEPAVLPPLPLAEWEPTKETLHRFVQIVGKIRLAAAPPANHWWHATLAVTSRGVSTQVMPVPGGDRTFAIDFDLIDHRLEIASSDGAVEAFPLVGVSVARFYAELFARLAALGIDVVISPRPFDLEPPVPFPADTIHNAYDATYITRYWRILAWVDAVFKEFGGRFTGKSSPVHLFWHSFDLALARFSGRRAPERPGADPVTREAYSHELISFGFWAGDAKVRTPAFYSYTAPEPPGLTDQPLRPAQAVWDAANGGALALLAYDDLRQSSAPLVVLLDFLESAYQAGARTAGWDQAALAAAIAT